MANSNSNSDKYSSAPYNKTRAYSIVTKLVLCSTVLKIIF